MWVAFLGPGNESDLKMAKCRRKGVLNWGDWFQGWNVELIHLLHSSFRVPGISSKE